MSNRNETVTYQLEGEAFDVFLARPEASGSRPAVLVFHTFGGRDGFAEGKARALAELGYVGAAIDLYGVGKRGTDRASSQALMSQLLADPALLRSRIGEAFRVVSERPGVDPARVGAVGFCFGGMCAILAARMGLPLRGIVSFHGLLKIGAPLPEAVRARLLILHGQDDPMVSPADVGAFAEEMKRVNADWELHAYPGVVHAFTNPVANDPGFGTVYDAEADRRSWSAMRRFFEEVFG
jgi:dienelactone hydrolase